MVCCMARLIALHPDNPQLRLIDQVIEVLHGGGVIVLPTDSSYALACLTGQRSAVDRIVRIRQLDPRHDMTLLCRDLSNFGIFARMDNSAYRLIKRLTPGPYTFLLKATKEVPRRLQHPQKKTIGLRVPAHNVTLSILGRLNEPLMSSSLILPGESLPETDADEINTRIGGQVDLVINGGAGGLEPTTVLDLTKDIPAVVRQGRGDTSML